jgi:glutamine amidotransferase
MSSPDITVVDYGVGNLLSVRRALEYCGATVVVTSNPDQVAQAAKLVLPGVGAFDYAMKALTDLGLVPAIQSASERVPLLGICLGMQLLLEESDEFNQTKGLGVIAGRVVALPRTTVQGDKLKVPHIGWNSLIEGPLSWKDTPLSEVGQDSAVYFVHSYMAVPVDPTHRLADCIYGGHRITAILKADNVMGCQFHPEKSGKVGLKILSGFINA